MSATIKLENIRKRYGSQWAVDDISFEVKKGEIVGFLGPNGAGKSTTMKILTCYLPQTEGKASVCGYDVMSDSMEVRKHVGYLPEHNPLYTDMYVREYLQFMAGLRKLGKESNARVERMIEQTGLGPEKNKKIGQLSKGYRQRVGLAQALLHEPDVLILDEPTSGLDPNQLVEIRSLIKQIGKDKTVILSTHIMQEVEALCNRVLIINQGKIVADDQLQNLQKQSATQVLQVQFKKAMSIQRLQGLNGVKKVEQHSEQEFKLYGDNQELLKEESFKLAVAEGTIILSMKEDEIRLERIFRDLTSVQKNQKEKKKGT